MAEDLSILRDSALFSGMEPWQIREMLPCLRAKTREYPRGDFILSVGESVDALGLVLSGNVHVVLEDFWGNRNLIAAIGPGEVFAESYACAPGTPLPVSVVAQEATTVLFLLVQRALSPCGKACAFHHQLALNLAGMLAAKNLRLNEKLRHVTQRTTREKLLSYLSDQARRTGEASFLIPFNRQELADYLSVDRSALSAELGKLRDEGLLRFSKNRFELIS